jgi:hypothetical protein
MTVDSECAACNVVLVLLHCCTSPATQGYQLHSDTRCTSKIAYIVLQLLLLLLQAVVSSRSITLARAL